MSLEEEAARTGGQWVKLEHKGDRLVGTIIDLDTDKPRTDPDGNVVLSRKTGKPRKVFHLTIQTDERDPDNPDDNGIRQFDANESAQHAILNAFRAWRKDNPSGNVEGCKFFIQIAEEREDSFSQHTYKAKFGERVTKPAAATPADDELPF